MTAQLYRHFDGDGQLLYVGISISTLNRLSQHKEHAHWFAEIANVTIENYSSRQEALAAERKAILKDNPKHNLMRPTSREDLAYSQAEASRNDLLKRIVRFNPIYSLSEAASTLNMSVCHLRSLMDRGEIGFIDRAPLCVRNTKAGPRTIRKFGITGWQLIEYIEALESEACRPRRKAA